MGQFGPSGEIFFEKETDSTENFLWKIVTNLQPVKFRLELNLPCNDGHVEFFVQNNEHLKKVCGEKQEIFGIQSNTVMVLLSTSGKSSLKLNWSPLADKESIISENACYSHTCSGKYQLLVLLRADIKDC